MTVKHTAYEAMVAAISHELNDFENWFIGLATGETTIQILSRVPLVAMALAQHTHAPNSFASVAGVMNPVVNEIPTALESEFGTSLQFWRCECRYVGFLAGRGEVDLGVGRVPQRHQQ